MSSIRQTTSFLRTSHLFRSTPQSSSPLLDLLIPHFNRQLRRLHTFRSPLALSNAPRHASRRQFGTFRRLRDSKPSSNPTQYNPTPHLNSPQESLSLTQRLKKLSREYGWSAFGVYMALTALDFPFCFLAVRWIGTERIGEWEHAIVEWVKKAVPFQIPEKYQFWRREKVVEEAEGGLVGEGGVLMEVEKVGEGVVAGYDHGVKEAERKNSGENASIWTQLALAYAIHKSFIFIRVPLTAAITPKVVKTLRGWGWNIGKRRPKPERLAAKAEKEAKKVAAIKK